jgi:tetrapyrrole methylase family protein / MazG family protein
MAGETRKFEELLAVVRELRQRCPWDREQTLAGSAKYLIEEAYEAADAIAHGDAGAIVDELGDLLVQVLFVATIAGEEKPSISLEGLLDGARRKLVRRHPHVYGEARAETVEQVLESWERIKHEEKRANGEQSGLAGVGRALPALMRAEKLGERARRAGMDWRDVRGVLHKVREELDEAEAALKAGDEAAAAEEIGDMMLALGNAPRFLGRSAEETMRRACEKFIARFERVQALASERGLDLKALSDQELDALWNEAKKRATGSPPSTR